MNQFNKSLPLDENDCIDFRNNTMIRYGRLKSAMHNLGETLKTHFKNQDIPFPDKHYNPKNGKNESFDMIREGVFCEVLKINSSGWQKGKLKIRVSVEFYPDEPESIEPPPSPLDDIRQSMI